MTFRHLEIFMSVYQNQSITKASKELHISQPSVSLAIKELEEKYQTPLFDRMNRQIYPTKKAHLLYNHSLQILSSLALKPVPIHESIVWISLFWIARS